MPKIALPIPVEEDVLLELPKEEDPEQEASVRVRQATVAEQERIAKLQDKVAREYSPDGSIRIIDGYNLLVVRRLQAYLTLTDCNLYLPDPEDPTNEDKMKPLFTFEDSGGRRRIKMNDQEFETAWGKLPQHWASAIIKAVFSVNKQWDINYQGE